MENIIYNILDHPETVLIPVFAFLIIFGLMLRAVIYRENNK